MLSCVIHRVLNSPGTFAEAGMMYVSLICAASGSAKRNRRAAANFLMVAAGTAGEVPRKRREGGANACCLLSSRRDKTFPVEDRRPRLSNARQARAPVLHRKTDKLG